MDEDESDKDISSYTENNGENSSEDDSEEESDDDANKDEEGTDASSEDDDEDGTDVISEEEDEDAETVSDDDDNRSEVASTVPAEETFDKGDLEDPDMSCPICLNELAGQDLGSPENCSHTFCFECILEWSKNINTCPIDRIEFHLIYVRQEINGDVIKKVKVKVQKEVEEYVEEVTLCEVCHLGDREDRLLLCDSCDSGYHCECLDPPLETIPIEEWFCPPCSQVLNRRGSPQASHSRLIARTSASEIVRSRIQHHRIANSGDSGSETTQQPQRVRSPARVQRRKMTKRKTKRKTTRKSSKSKTKKARTKATAAGKSKTKKGSSKSPIKRKRKTKRRKGAKKKKKSKKSWLASMKLVAPSVKKRIADHLGLCKPPAGHSMPYVKKSGGQHSAFIEQLPSLDMFGCKDQLFDFGESYTDDDLDNPKPSTSKQSQAVVSNVPRSPVAVASTSGFNLLDNILEKQNDLLRNSKNLTIGKDGSLSRNEKDSSVKIKCGIKSFKNEPRNDASVSEENKATASSSSSVYVKKEKNTLETESPLVDTNKITSEDTSSSVHPVICSVKKENPSLLPCVRFSDTETVFKIENDNVCEQTETVVEGEYNVPCSSRSMQGKEDIPLEKMPVSVKKEKDDLPSNSLMDTKSMNNELQAMVTASDFNRDRLNKQHRVNGKENHQFRKDSLVSPLSVLNGTCRPNSCSVISTSGASTNELYSPFNNCKSTKDVLSSDNPDLVHANMDETSSSMFDKAENDRKRHLPFLSNSLQRPFKIPKLSKSKDTSLVSETKLPSSESISSKVLTKSETVCGNLKSKNKSLVLKTKLPSSESISNKVLTKSENVLGNFVPKEAKSVNKISLCDSKMKTGYQKHFDVSEAMDIDAYQNNPSGAAAKRLLETSKQEKTSEFSKSHKKSDLNCKSSSRIMPKLSCPKNSLSSGKRHSSEGMGVSSQKVHHTSHSGVDSDSVKFDRKMQDNSTSLSSKEVKNKECKHILNVSVCVVQNSKPTKKSPPVNDTENKASDKIMDKVPSKQKLKEDIVAEIKKHLKDFYVTDLITKDEYKEIMRRSVPKVFQNCGNSIDSAKIRKLVVSYVNIISNTKADVS